MSREIGIDDRRADLADTILVVLFLLGIYLNLSIDIGVPLPNALSGVAGAALLIRHWRRLRERHVVALLVVLLLFLVSILCAADDRWLFERFKGYVQISYSFIIGYAFFIAVLQYGRDRLARIFFGFCAIIVVGCAFENYGGLRPISDAFRAAVFESGVYANDLRDVILYDTIRPKLFTSEPSLVTFSYTLFAFAWLVLSTWRLKLLAYAVLLAAGFFLMRGPTLLLGFLLVIPYELFLSSRKSGGGYDLARLAVTLVLAALLLVAFYAVGTTLYSERLDQITSGSDPSFFSRVIGPALVAQKVAAQHPIAGAGLTGVEFIANIAFQVFETSPNFPADLDLSVESLRTHLVNYFWLHWIYLGVVWGVVMLVALAWYLRMLGTPSLLFCGAVWVTFGPAAGAYVAPSVWLILYLSCALAILHQRPAVPAEFARPVPLRRMRFRGSPIFRPTPSAS